MWLRRCDRASQGVLGRTLDRVGRGAACESAGQIPCREAMWSWGQSVAPRIQCTKMGCTETKGELRQGAPVVTVETIRVLYARRKLSDRDSGPYPAGMHLGADSDSPMWR